jgi:hypothetical protein
MYVASCSRAGWLRNKCKEQAMPCLARHRKRAASTGTTDRDVHLLVALRGNVRAN